MRWRAGPGGEHRVGSSDGAWTRSARGAGRTGLSGEVCQTTSSGTESAPPRPARHDDDMGRYPEPAPYGASGAYGASDPPRQRRRPSWRWFVLGGALLVVGLALTIPAIVISIASFARIEAQVPGRRGHPDRAGRGRRGLPRVEAPGQPCALRRGRRLLGRGGGDPGPRQHDVHARPRETDRGRARSPSRRPRVPSTSPAIPPPARSRSARSRGSTLSWAGSSSAWSCRS